MSDRRFDMDDDEVLDLIRKETDQDKEVKIWLPVEDAQPLFWLIRLAGIILAGIAVWQLVAGI